MNKEIESILLQFKTAIDFAKGPSRIKYNFKISDAEKLYEYIINTKKENQRLQLALKNSKLSYKNIIQKSENRKEEIKRLYKQREKLWKRKAFLGKENQRLNNVLNELEKLTISICENCYEDRETERIKKRINELKESNNGQ